MHKKPTAAARYLSPSLKGKPGLHDPPYFLTNSKNSSLSISYAPSPGAISSSLSSVYSKLKRSRAPKSDTPGELKFPAPGERPIPETKLVLFREESPKPHQPATIFTFSLLPSLQFPSIPRQPHTPLSFSGPERFQISDMTSLELDFKLCVFPFFGYLIQKQRELTPFVQSLCGVATIETIRNLSHRSQTRCHTARRPFEYYRPSILRPRFGWARNVFLRWFQTHAKNDPIAGETFSKSLGTNRGY